MKKKALVVDCNYPNKPRGWTKLNGANAAHEMLVTDHGFNPRDISVLTDALGSNEMPTAKTIKSALEDVISEIGEEEMDFRCQVNSLPEGATFVFFADCCHGLFDQKKEQIGPTMSSENCRSIPYEAVLAVLDETPALSRGRPNISNTDIKSVMLDKFGSDASLLFMSSRFA